ncbi:hypothetical protein [Neobacillus vireti]|uniref:hypothetical protein n=1 Tax=Neobacillus vireti TaxID=220686 RepID=UPI002FFFFEA2
MLEEENEIHIKRSHISWAECGVCFQNQATGQLDETLIDSCVLSGIAILEGSTPRYINAR